MCCVLQWLSYISWVCSLYWIFIFNIVLLLLYVFRRSMYAWIAYIKECGSLWNASFELSMLYFWRLFGLCFALYVVRIESSDFVRYVGVYVFVNPFMYYAVSNTSCNVYNGCLGRCFWCKLAILVLCYDGSVRCSLVCVA